ncbi:MAG: DUF6930 domain-containing protein [Planctomycetales bacterium]
MNRKGIRPANDNERETQASRIAVPRRFPLDDLLSLPLRRETWQMGLIPFGEELPGDQEPMWLFGVAFPDGQEIRAVNPIDQPPTEEVVWNELIQSFLSPVDGAPARPVSLVVCRREFLEAWKPLLSKIGVRCRFEEDPQPIGQLLEGMRGLVDKLELPPAEGIDIREFPQSDAVWQADFVRSPGWVSNERNGSYRPWSVLVLEKSRSIALSSQHAPGDPAPEMLLEFLVRTMAQPMGFEPQRPRLIEVADSDSFDYLRPRLEAAGVTVRLLDELREFDEFCLGLARNMEGSEKCALADGREVTRAQMESFYEAADFYYRAAPWHRVPGEVPIEISCNDPAMGTRYGIVLGRTGVQMGLCIYDDREILEEMLCGFASPEDNRALAVCYDTEEIMSAVDLQLIERLGWPIAGPQAWPAVMRLRSRRSPISPNADELTYLDACLRAIPDFLKSKAPTRTIEVPIGPRVVTLRLASEMFAKRRR